MRCTKASDGGSCGETSCEICDSKAPRAQWQKDFVKNAQTLGVSHSDAMIVMGLVCELRENAYLQGFTNGVNSQ